MNNNKQSSIEYLAKELNSLSFDYLVGQVSNKEHGERYNKIIEQAKAMHKEEIIDAVGVGSQFDRDYLYGYHDKAEQYYNEHYGNS